MARDRATEITEVRKAEELHGKLEFQQVEDKLMHSVLENDRNTIDQGKVVEDALNMGINSFTPDLMFDQITRNYSIAKKLFGETILRLICGYDPDYIKKNIGIPEFRRELQERIEKNIDRLKKEDLLDKEGTITERGVELASLILYTEELDNIIPKGILGEKMHKKHSHYGDRGDVHDFRQGDRYKDLALRRSVKIAARRGHKKIFKHDLKTFERQSKGLIHIIYALDASGSMKGKKIEVSKKAGIALAYKALEEKDKVGVMVFGSDIKQEIPPTDDFTLLLKAITSARASRETDLSKTISRAADIFPKDKATKHLLLLTDVLPTIGKNPEEDTLEAVSRARSAGITISLVGINLDSRGKKLAEKIVRLGEGRLYVIRNLEDLDKIVLEDYYSVL
ncbi:VWA domain-containing protein [Candidatus Woesearchaeota archaeon]|nr:VWA domain-containing protein [Candidatus Woesearchaeota archaeon]